MRQSHRIIPGLLLLAAAAVAQAQSEPGILDSDTVLAADAEALEQDAQVFETMSKGVALSLAECEITEACMLAVSRPELERIVQTLESRITVLTQRHSETGNPDLEPVLLSYAGARDEYSGLLEKLGEVEPVPAPEDAFSGEAEALPEEYEVFQDFDEDLTDDESLDEFDTELPADEAEDLE